MRTTQTNIPVEKLAEFGQRWKLSELSIFGSILRDDFRPDSDVDVLIDFLPGEEMTLEKYVDMRDELEAIFGRPVDLVEKPLVRNPYRRQHILLTREIVYTA